MTTVGAYEAKTHLPRLLAQVARGQKILITQRGKPVAMLVPAPVERSANVREVIEEMKALRRGNVLGKDLSIRDLVEEGRRF